MDSQLIFYNLRDFLTLLTTISAIPTTLRPIEIGSSIISKNIITIPEIANAIQKKVKNIFSLLFIKFLSIFFF